VRVFLEPEPEPEPEPALSAPAWRLFCQLQAARREAQSCKPTDRRAHSSRSESCCTAFVRCYLVALCHCSCNIRLSLPFPCSMQMHNAQQAALDGPFSLTEACEAAEVCEVCQRTAIYLQNIKEGEGGSHFSFFPLRSPELSARREKV
jgi:hypothetical protein